MARTVTDLHALVRQASAERFPHPTPPGFPARRQNVSSPGLSLIDLWVFYAMPEVRAISDRISSGVERVNFRPCLNVEGSSGDKCPPLIDEAGELAEGISDRFAADCTEIWAQVRSPSGNQSDIFGPIATSLTVAGDAWQFGYPGTPEMRWDPNGTPMWVGVARHAITELNEQYVVEVGIDGAVKVPSSETVEGHGTAIRIWIPDPQRPAMASTWLVSCVRSLQILSSIYEAVAAVALSRMNAGLIVAPSDQDPNPIPSSQLVNDGNPALYPLGEPLQQALYDELGDHVEDSAQVMDGMSRAVPAVIGVHSSIADKVKWIELARSLDPQLGETIDDLRMRIFRTCPLPPEVSEGMATVSGLGGGNVAAQIDQSEYQRAILPVCERIAWANTQFVLREGLMARGYSQLEVDRVQIGFTAKNLLMPPDRSESAIAIASMKQPVPALSNAELREAAGMGEFAGPEPEEARLHLILHLASANPAYAYLLPLAGLPAPEAPTVESPSEVIDVDETPPAIEAPEEPEDEPAEAQVRQASADPHDVGGDLVAISTRYEESLTVLFGAIIDRMAERASSTIASMSLKKSWAGVRDDIRLAKASAPGLIGALPQVQAQLAAEDVDDGDLFEPALAAFAPRFQSLTTAAQKRAVRTAGAEWSDFEAQADQANAAAWAMAGGLLISEARYRFDGKLPEQTGEASVDPFGIPSGIVRRTSAVAGGDDDVVPGADPDKLSTQNLGSVATALLATAALVQAGRTVVGWEWDYRPEIIRNTFEDHFDLHGEFTEGPEPGDVGGWFCGDHKGCECLMRPVTGLGQRGEGVTF